MRSDQNYGTVRRPHAARIATATQVPLVEKLGNNKSMLVDLRIPRRTVIASRRYYWETIDVFYPTTTCAELSFQPLYLDQVCIFASMG